MTPILATLTFWDFVIVAVLIAIFAGGFAVRDRIVLRRVERKLDLLLRHEGLRGPGRLSPEVQALADDPAKKNDAIELYRKETGADLPEAVEAVEAYLEDSTA